MNASSIQLWLCDLACIKHTNKSIPVIALAIIYEHAKPHYNEKKNAMHQKECEIIPKGAKKGKWAKHILTKYRMKQAFRYR